MCITNIKNNALSAKLTSCNGYIIPIAVLMFVFLYAFSPAHPLIQPAQPVRVTAPLDSVKKDSVKKDSVTFKISKDALKNKVSYHAADSTFLDVKNRKLYLITKAEVTYENVKINADYICIDWKKNELIAYGIHDSFADSTMGRPVLSIDNEPYESDTMRYNFVSKKGKMKSVRTKQGDGFLYGETVKRDTSQSLFLKHGWYTTCSDEHPHFEIAVSKVKVIPNKSIISGPAHLVIADVPTPLVIPFGFFPINKGHRNGILIPRFVNEESPNGRGFGLNDGGYYIHIKDYADLRLTGSIFSKGSWIISAGSSYVQRYRYNGNVSFNYNVNKIGEPRTYEQTVARLFLITWNHTMDARVRPGTTFSANVNLQSGGAAGNYLRRNTTNSTEFLNNEIRSNISYSKSFMKGKMMLALNANHSQNTLSHAVNATLPSGQFYINSIYPFRFKEHPGSAKWYEKINTTYNLQFANSLTSNDSLFYNKEQYRADTLKKYLRNGLQHSIPLSTSFNLLKYFNVATGVTFNQRFYFNSIEKTFVEKGNYNGTKDTVLSTVKNGFHSPVDMGFSAGISTRIFGKFNFYNTRLIAIRHVLTPSVSFSYHPDYSEAIYGYYRKVKNPDASTYTTYSIFENGIYGSPALGKSAMLSLNLGNNLESKWKNKKDTITGVNKISLLDYLNFGTYYNLLADSMKLGNINVSGGTSILKKININFSGALTPYDKDSSKGNEYYVNRYLIQNGKGTLARIINFHTGFVFSFNGNPAQKKKPVSGFAPEVADIENRPYNYIDFNIPWNLHVNYNIDYNVRNKYIVSPTFRKFTQSLSLNGDFNITTNWKLAASMQVNPLNVQIQYVTVDLYRDLHCWDMRLQIIPIGDRRGFNFTIQAKSALLQQLKLTRRFDARYY